MREHEHFPAEVMTSGSGRGVIVWAKCRCGATLFPEWKVPQ